MKYLHLLFVVLIISCHKKEINKIGETQNLYYERAYDFLDAGKSDSSFYLFEKAKQNFLENNDSLGVAKCLVNMAITQREKGDYYGSQETSLEALKYLNLKAESDRVYLSTNYNNLANATHNLSDFSKAIDFYNQAIFFSDDSLNSNIYRNNLAISYWQMQDYNSAIIIFEGILKNVENDRKQYARVLSNLAYVKWKRDINYKPAPELERALKIREKEKDLWGQNASLAHLADYYEQTKPDSSLYYARKQFLVAKTLNSGDDQIKAIERLIKVISPDSVTFYFNRYKIISDSIQQARAAAKNQFALIRYEVEKNKADNLRLEKENVEKQNRLVRQRAITGASIFLLLLAVGGGTLWYKRRKQRLELEAQNRVKETQLHLSKRIHDVVANGIYRVMSEIEHGDEVDRDGVLDKLENMYHQSRDISHDVEQETITEIPYNEQLASLLKSFAADHRKVLIAGNDAEQWDDISKRIKDEVKHVLQELMVNMKKHSQAEQVVVRFEKSEQKLNIFYKDNGVGIQQEKSNGKGLGNTVSRIESLGGKITFVNEPGKGLNITTVIPL
ncbi:tetratricopeptide repeat-containing sensor histidine kinase [Sphingobacterium multivorum]|uniref:tetratricopeptide repeat-containing sensor histidine kinase n=1 Tax=Sphingobacterium multivorum TaxID=28454 RepID=UPI00345E600A